MHALKNTWYQAAWSNELTGEHSLSRTILNTAIFLYRQSNGAVAALYDRCPHRFAPLSAGCVSGDNVTCGYHGLTFDPKGQCINNPHGAITQRLQVRAYPVVEKHTAIWIWMGDPSLADPGDIPDLSFIDDAPEETRICGYMHTNADYQLMIDNIMDLSHADYLHPDTLGGMMTDAETNVWQDDENICVHWLAKNAGATGAFAAMADDSNRLDISIQVEWQSPTVMVLILSAVKPGVNVSQDDESRTLHNMVPEASGRTHYFYCQTRRFLLDSPEFTSMLRESIRQAFEEEDKPVLEKQQESIGANDFWEMSPVLLSIDTAAVQVRRKLDKLIKDEQA